MVISSPASYSPLVRSQVTLYLRATHDLFNSVNNSCLIRNFIFFRGWFLYAPKDTRSDEKTLPPPQGEKPNRPMQV